MTARERSPSHGRDRAPRACVKGFAGFCQNVIQAVS